MLLLVQERFKVLVLNVIDLWLRTLLAHHSVIHFQQKRCPHGVAVFSCSFSKHSAHFIPLLVLMLVAAGLSCETRRSNGLPDFRCCSDTDNSMFTAGDLSTKWWTKDCDSPACKDSMRHEEFFFPYTQPFDPTKWLPSNFSLQYHPESQIMVARLNETITKKRSPWLLNKFFFSAP